MSSIYYVYAYLNKDGTPYYIGKGKDQRAYAKHGTHNPPPKERIVFCETNLSELGAFAIERRLIRWFGRRGIDEHGTLLNRAEGGQGVSMPMSENTKKKLSESLTGRKITEQHRENIRKASDRGDLHRLDGETSRMGIEKRKKLYPNGTMIGKKQTEKQKETASRVHKGKIVSEETKQKMKDSFSKIERKKCPHCSRDFRPATFSRWHGKNCKNKQ